MSKLKMKTTFTALLICTQLVAIPSFAAQKSQKKSIQSMCEKEVTKEGFNKQSKFCRCLVKKSLKHFEEEKTFTTEFFKQVILGQYPKRSSQFAADQSKGHAHDAYEDDYDLGIEIAEACIKETKTVKKNKKK